mmetsp:Transcript_21332/g.42610  ORF Transcript_21332/g.42610 Transcript_21332/m.42610 type:complete len:233 (-) Transcript_21332:227-925(-)
MTMACSHSSPFFPDDATHRLNAAAFLTSETLSLRSFTTRLPMEARAFMPPVLLTRAGTTSTALRRTRHFSLSLSMPSVGSSRTTCFSLSTGTKSTSPSSALDLLMLWLAFATARRDWEQTAGDLSWRRRWRMGRMLVSTWPLYGLGSCGSSSSLCSPFGPWSAMSVSESLSLTPSHGLVTSTSMSPAAAASATLTSATSSESIFCMEPNMPPRTSDCRSLFLKTWAANLGMQ